MAKQTLLDIMAQNQPPISHTRQPGRTFNFDPEADDYFSEIDDILIAEYPLEDDTKPPLIGPPEPTYARQSWVHHPELNDYVKHSGSVTDRIELLGPELASEVRGLYGDDVYLFMKGRGHPSYELGKKGEEARGYMLEKGPGGYYYSVPDPRTR
mgnify:CR=1 FL=1